LPSLPSKKNIEVTNYIEDVVSLNDLKDKYKNHHGLRGVSDRDFMAIAKALFTSKGFEIRDRQEWTFTWPHLASLASTI